MRVQAIPATILAVTTENALTDLTTLATMVGGACTERRNKSIFHLQRKLYVQLNLNACTFCQGHCDEYGCAVNRQSSITTARSPQSSGTTDGTLARTLDNEIDLAGSQSLEM